MGSTPAQIKNTEPLAQLIGAEKSYDGCTLAFLDRPLDAGRDAIWLRFCEDAAAGLAGHPIGLRLSPSSPRSMNW